MYAYIHKCIYVTLYVIYLSIIYTPSGKKSARRMPCACAFFGERQFGNVMRIRREFPKRTSGECRHGNMMRICCECQTHVGYKNVPCACGWTLNRTKKVLKLFQAHAHEHTQRMRMAYDAHAHEHTQRTCMTYYAHAHGIRCACAFRTYFCYKNCIF